MLLPCPCALAGTCSVPAEVRAGAGICSHRWAAAAGELEGSPAAPGAGVPMGNASQIAL